jgi:hypothetical protein
MPEDVAAAWRRPRGALESSRIVQHARKPYAKTNRQQAIGARHWKEMTKQSTSRGRNSQDCLAALAMTGAACWMRRNLWDLVFCLSFSWAKARPARRLELPRRRVTYLANVAQWLGAESTAIMDLVVESTYCPLQTEC